MKDGIQTVTARDAVNNIKNQTSVIGCNLVGCLFKSGF